MDIGDVFGKSNEAVLGDRIRYRHFVVNNKKPLGDIYPVSERVVSRYGSQLHFKVYLGFHSHLPPVRL